MFSALIVSTRSKTFWVYLVLVFGMTRDCLLYIKVTGYFYCYIVFFKTKCYSKYCLFISGHVITTVNGIGNDSR